MTTRVFPPTSGSTSITVHSRTTTAAGSPYVDAPDHDAMVMTANGWMQVPPGGQVGATAQRPVNTYRGLLYLDLTLGKIVIHDGKVWRDPATGSAV